MALTKLDLARCPVCFSILITPYENLANVAQYLKDESIIPPQTDISPENDDLEEIVIDGLKTLNLYVWHGDPIKTPKGEAGNDYRGFTFINPTHFIELQEARQEQELNAGIPEEERTTFTPVDTTENRFIQIAKKHLRELRESTEKILMAFGQTKEVSGEENPVVDLENYFNYDEDAREYNIGDHQLDWHDSDLSEKFLNIKAVHIEDLRHAIPIGLVEWFAPTPPGVVNNIYGTKIWRDPESGNYLQYRVLLKRDGNYLATRFKEEQTDYGQPFEFIDIYYVDINGNLTSKTYPEPTNTKFTWSLEQWFAPVTIFAYRESSSWNNFVFSDYIFPGQPFEWERIANFTNSYLSFVSKGDGSSNKDVLFYNNLSITNKSPSTTGGYIYQYLTYHFDETSYSQVGKGDTKFSFKITDWNKGFNCNRLYRPVQYYLFFWVGVEGTETGALEYICSYAITDNGNYEIMLKDMDSIRPSLPDNYRITYIKFISITFLEVKYPASLWYPYDTETGNIWNNFKLVTPIKIVI